MGIIQALAYGSMQEIPFGTKFGNSLMVMLIGVTVVFIALVVLIIICTISGKLMGGVKKAKKTEKEHTQTEAPAAAPAPAAPVQAAPVQPAEDDEEIAAVIAAVVAMMGAAGKPAGSFSVRKVRRTGAWGKAGREELLSSRNYN